jgi:hypothetical protein
MRKPCKNYCIEHIFLQELAQRSLSIMLEGICFSHISYNVSFFLIPSVTYLSGSARMFELKRYVRHLQMISRRTTEGIYWGIALRNTDWLGTRVRAPILTKVGESMGRYPMLKNPPRSLRYYPLGFIALLAVKIPTMKSPSRQSPKIIQIDTA